MNYESEKNNFAVLIMQTEYQFFFVNSKIFVDP